MLNWTDDSSDPFNNNITLSKSGSETVGLGGKKLTQIQCTSVSQSCKSSPQASAPILRLIYIAKC